MSIDSLYIINNEINVFHVTVFINAGGVTEPEKKLGISHMLEHMLFQTPKTKELVHSITRSGAVINGATDIDTTMYYVKADASAYKQALHLISSIVFDSYFTSNDLEKERKVVIEELYKSDGDTEGSVIWEMSNLTLLSSSHLYMRRTIGTIESLRALTVADLKKYYKEHYSNAIIVVNCPRNLVKPVEEFFKGGMTRSQTPVILPQIEKEIERKVIIFNKDQEQTMYVFTFAFFPDKPSLKLRLTIELLHHMLSGAGMKSLLMKELREKRGLVYTPHSAAEFMKQMTLFKIVISSSSPDIKLVVRIIMELLRSIRKPSFSREIFSYFKQSFHNELKLALNNPDYVTSFIGDVYKNLLVKSGVQRVSTGDVLSAIKSISHGDLVKVMNEHLSFDNLGIFASGPFPDPKGLASEVLEMIE
jgi:predicted Zn-dependent peptidase